MPKNNERRICKRLGLIFCSGLIAACATPAENFKKTAFHHGFVEQEIQGKGFRHKVYANAKALDGRQRVLNVYLDGDGKPFKNALTLAADPTSRNHLILDLMAADNQPALMLGRPCYHGFSLGSAVCDARFWTSARYSKQVVESMIAALKNWLERHPFENILLAGFSGGGTLAVLMADKIPEVTAIITIAANLDTAAWSKHHGQPALKDSLNPIEHPPLKKEISQLHLAGAKDEQVPAFIGKAYTDRQENASFRIYEDFTHHCCWPDLWKTVLRMQKNGMVEQVVD